MAYNKALEKRIVDALQHLPAEVTNEFTEKKMFGGIAFLYKGKMTVGIIKEDLMVRVVQEKMKSVLAMENVREMDFAKRPMKEFIYVSAGSYESQEQLLVWIRLGLEHAQKKLLNSK
tara:strand:- start:4120 stop:4470 length:351 start_codon:yes stop_codon:yes gene_type:complete